MGPPSSFNFFFLRLSYLKTKRVLNMIQDSNHINNSNTGEINIHNNILSIIFAEMLQEIFSSVLKLISSDNV